MFGVRVTELPGEEFAVAGTAAVDGGAGGTLCAFCEGVIAIPDGSVASAAAIAPAGGGLSRSLSRASATPLMAVLARQMAITPRAIPIFKRIMMSSGDDVQTRFIGGRHSPFTLSAPNFETVMTGNCFRIFCKIAFKAAL
jgi:hypothetical protein